MADQSLFVYSGMENAAKFYSEKAAEISTLCKDIKNRNQQLVSEEWNGDSALAFTERFDSDHAKKMETLAEALTDISTTITELVRSRQEWEADQAGKFGV